MCKLCAQGIIRRAGGFGGGLEREKKEARERRKERERKKREREKTDMM